VNVDRPDHSATYSGSFVRGVSSGRDEKSSRGLVVSTRISLASGRLLETLPLPGVCRIHIERIHQDVYCRITGAPQVIEIVAFWDTRWGAGSPI
jgi:hypothetical protein